MEQKESLELKIKNLVNMEVDSLHEKLSSMQEELNSLKSQWGERQIFGTINNGFQDSNKRDTPIRETDNEKKCEERKEKKVKKELFDD